MRAQGRCLYGMEERFLNVSPQNSHPHAHTAPLRAGRCRFCAWLVALASLFFGAPIVWADQIWLDKPTGAPLFPTAKIVRVENKMLVFLVGGNETRRDLDRIARIAVDDEVALTQAEEAMALEKFDEAVDAYQKAARSSTKPWVRDWAAGRLVVASSRSGRFDAAASAYIALVLKDPATAAARKPKLPVKGSTFLDTAVAQVTTALATPRLTDAQTTALLTFLVELHVARQDDAAASAATEKLDEFLARDPNNPAAARANARRKLQAAARLLAEKKYAPALAAVDAHRAAFTETDQQAEAMFLIAEARSGMADSTDRKALADAALAYMRVVAHFKDVPDSPRVADSLARAAAICEAMGDPAAATQLYSDVVKNHPNNEDAAAIAQRALDRLKGT